MKVGFEKNLHLILSEPWERKNHRSHWRPILCKLDFLLGCASRLTISFISDFYFLLLLALLLFIQLNFSSSSSYSSPTFLLSSCALRSSNWISKVDILCCSPSYRAPQECFCLFMLCSCTTDVRDIHLLYLLFYLQFTYFSSSSTTKTTIQMKKKCKYMLSSTSSCGRVRALCTQLNSNRSKIERLE